MVQEAKKPRSREVKQEDRLGVWACRRIGVCPRDVGRARGPVGTRSPRVRCGRSVNRSFCALPTLFGRATPVARERNPTAPHDGERFPDMHADTPIRSSLDVPRPVAQERNPTAPHDGERFPDMHAETRYADTFLGPSTPDHAGACSERVPTGRGSFLNSRLLGYVATRNEPHPVRRDFRATVQFLPSQQVKSRFFKSHRLRSVREVQKKAEPFGPV
jgi:hypothetical protein